MEKQQNRQKFNEAKLKFAVIIGYFNHHNFFLNVSMAAILSLLAGVVIVGISNTFYPLLTGNYIHMIYMFLIFSVLELLIKYFFYKVSFQSVLKSRGIMLFPNQVLLFFALEIFFDLKFTSFLAIFGFVLLFSFIRSGVSYIFISIKKYFSKEV